MGEPTIRRKIGATLVALLVAAALSLGGFATQEAYADQPSATQTSTKVAAKATPKKTSITSVKANSKSSVTVTWKKLKSGISGYEIKYSKNKSMRNATIKRVGKTTSSKKISGLKASTKYYVQVRSYKNVDGKKYVSAWSAKKSVKTKAAPKSKAKATGGTVYITNTGEKYHRSTCRSLRASKHAISKSSAIAQGYTACKVCRP